MTTIEQEIFFILEAVESFYKEADRHPVSPIDTHKIYLPLAYMGWGLEILGKKIPQDPDWRPEGRYAGSTAEGHARRWALDLAEKYRQLSEELSGDMPESSKEWAERAQYWENWAQRWRPFYSPGLAGMDYHPDPWPY